MNDAMENVMFVQLALVGIRSFSVVIHEKVVKNAIEPEEAMDSRNSMRIDRSFRVDDFDYSTGSIYNTPTRDTIAHPVASVRLMLKPH